MGEGSKILRPVGMQVGKGNGDGEDKPKACPFRSAGFAQPTGANLAGVGQQIAMHIMSAPCLRAECMMWSKKDEWCNLLLRNA